MAADPILDETAILSMLAEPAAHRTIEQLQGAAVVAIIDAFDRRIHRDEFCKVVGSAVALHSYLARLYFSNTVKVLTEHDSMSLEKLENSIKQTTLDAERERKDLYHLLSLVRECAGSGVPVH